MLDISWSAILDECLNKIGEQWPSPPTMDKPSPEGKAVGSTITGIMYSGNIHETVPKQLLLDNRLTPLERNGWQVFKMLLDKQGFAAPRYEDLQPYLSMVPYGEKASKETIARVIHTLRLTRWLSLISKGRDKKTGQHLGSIYILHDEPITPAEALQLDINYLDFVVNCCKHANKSISIVANKALEDLNTSDNSAIQTRLSLMAKRIQLQSAIKSNKSNKKEKIKTALALSLESELSNNTPVRNRVKPSSESEPRLNSPISNSVRIPNSYSTSTVFIHKSTSTVLNHPLLKNITDQQRSALNQFIENLDTELVNQVMSEFEHRCDGSINNPINYLIGLFKRAKNNEFKPWLTKTTIPSSPVTKTQAIYCRDTSQSIPIEVQKQLEDIKNILSVKK